MVIRRTDGRLGGGLSRTRPLDRARESFRRGAWTAARNELIEADRVEPLDAEDLERLAIASHLIGRHGESSDAWGRAHREWLRTDHAGRAVRAAFWLAFGL